jgi:hypothetical protein
MVPEADGFVLMRVNVTGRGARRNGAPLVMD